MKKSKKIVSFLLVVAIMLTSVNQVSAVLNPGYYGDYKFIDANNSKIATGYSVELSWPNVINKCKWSGTSSTVWYGSTPYNADSIRHTNSIYVGGIGKISLASDAIGCSVDGSTINDVFEVANEWKINTNFEYEIKRAMFMTTSDFSISSRTQLGTNFYSRSFGT